MSMSSTPAMRRLSREPMAAAGKAVAPGDTEQRGGERPAPTAAAAARGTPGKRVRPPYDYSSRQAPRRRLPTAAPRGGREGTGRGGRRSRTPHGLPRGAECALPAEGAARRGPGRGCGCGHGDGHGKYPGTQRGWGNPWEPAQGRTEGTPRDTPCRGMHLANGAKAKRGGGIRLRVPCQAVLLSPGERSTCW